ncbi:MAG: FtsX-like permease family protein, partial [Planctomycetales bacterium]|nr:FtsX-like permease family protein [Planctomycetales bacterium]
MLNQSLAWKNLLHNRVRTAIGMAGVGFAAMLMFMQMGFKGAIEKTATQIYDALDFDLMLRSPAYLHLTEPRTFPRTRLLQAASLPEIDRADPLYIGLSVWQAPDYSGQKRRSEQYVPGMGRSIITLGVDPSRPPFTREDLRQAAQELTSDRYVVLDSKSKAEYGPRNGRYFTREDIGAITTLGANVVEVVGLFELGAGMASNGSCMTNVEGYLRASPWQSPDDITFGLLRLTQGAEPDAVVAELNNLFQGQNVEVLTRDEVRRREEQRWMADTPFGLIFNFLVVVSVLVGVAIVYQVLSNDIANLMSEYATLKAMGYSNPYLASVILRQSVLLALAGYVPALVVCWQLYAIVGNYAGIPMIMTPKIIGSVLALSLG